MVVGIITFMGVDLLTWSGDKVGIHDFGKLARFGLGCYGDYLVDGSIFITNSGALVSYVIVIGTLAQSIILTYRSSGWYSNVSFLSGIIVGVFVTPFCLIPKFGHLALISYFSICAITATVFLVLIGGPIDSAPYSSESLNFGSFLGSIETLGAVVFAFGYSSAVFHSYIAMVPRTPEVFTNVLIATTTIGVIMCFLVGLAGYLSFRDSTDADILLNFTGTVGTIFKTIVIIHLIFYIPGDYVIMRYSFFRLLELQVDDLSEVTYVVSTLLLLGSITALACLMQEYLGSNEAFSLILNITGGIGSSVTNFIVPGLIAMEVLQHNDYDYYRGLTVTVFGFAVQILVLASVFISIANGFSDDDS